MKLRELDASFIRYETRIEPRERIVGDAATWRERGCPTETVTGPREHMVRVDTLAEAQGVLFRCPKCAGTNGPGSGHYVQVTFANRGVTDAQGCHGKDGKPTRWQVAGTSLDDLTTKPSILLFRGCEWHGYITNGDAA